MLEKESGNAALPDSNRTDEAGRIPAGIAEMLPALSDIMVILEFSSQDCPAYVGRLVEVGRESVTFDYLVMDKSLEDRINQSGEVRLKTFSDLRMVNAPIPCRIVSDTCPPNESFFNLSIRRCSLRLLIPFPVA